MRFIRIVAVAMACAAMLCTHAASAGSRPFKVRSLAGVPFRKVYLPGADAAQEVCKLGQYGTPVGVIGDEIDGGTVFFNEQDTYWTYLELRPDSCAGCGAYYAGAITMAHLTLYFPFAPETVTVNVSVVGSVPIPCHYPDYTDPNAVICDAFSTTLDCQEALTIVDYAIPVPPGCKITALPQQNGDVYGTGFLGFEFVTASDTSQLHKPQIAVGANAKTCYSFNPVGFYPWDIVSNYLVGNPIMYAEVAACESVPTRRSTWGRLKMRYR